MKPPRLMLSWLLLAVPGLLAGADAPGVRSAEPARPSPEITQRLNAVLPKYAPPPPEAKRAEPSPDAIELPKITVTQKKRPRLTPEVMMTKAAFNEKLARENLSDFDRNILNKFVLPAWFGGYSAEQRARDEYERQQKAELISEVRTIAKAVEETDPARAKALRDDAGKP